jgi:hypothetical protein
MKLEFVCKVLRIVPAGERTSSSKDRERVAVLLEPKGFPSPEVPYLHATELIVSQETAKKLRYGALCKVTCELEEV